MLVASDTSPICNLAIIGRLNLLQELFGALRIPAAVMRELDRLSHPDAVKHVQQAVREGWIQPQAVQNERVARLLEATLDPGEAEAIALALEVSAALILL